MHNVNDAYILQREGLDVNTHPPMVERKKILGVRDG